MKIEDRKLISISRAIGLLMLFEGIFRRNDLESVIFSDTFTDVTLKIFAYLTLYLFPLAGILLCITRSLLFFHFAYLVLIFSLFGTIFEFLPGQQIRLAIIISLFLVHLVLMLVLMWAHFQIKEKFLSK